MIGKGGREGGQKVEGAQLVEVRDRKKAFINSTEFLHRVRAIRGLVRGRRLVIERRNS